MRHEIHEPHEDARQAALRVATLISEVNADRYRTNVFESTGKKYDAETFTVAFHGGAYAAVMQLLANPETISGVIAEIQKERSVDERSN